MTLYHANKIKARFFYKSCSSKAVKTELKQTACKGIYFNIIGKKNERIPSFHVV